MDFFAAGGFQQLFSDLNDTQLYCNWTDINAELEEGPMLYDYNYYTHIPLDSNMPLTCSNDPFVYASSSDEQRLTELHMDWDESGAEVSETEHSERSKSNEKELQKTLDRLLSSPAEGSPDGSSSAVNSRPQSSPAESSTTLSEVVKDSPVYVSSVSDSPVYAVHTASSPAPLTHCEAISLTQANSSGACKLNKSLNYNNPITHNDLDSSILVEFETAEYITREMSEWEEKFLDNYIEIDELIDFLPEKTPLCTETCEHFLIESSKNLKLHRRARVPKRVSTTSSQIDQPTNGYPCTFATCDKVYAKPAHLKAHMRRHMGEKPYTCDWPACTWKFSRSDELARHRRSHSGVKPYKCNYCLKCFARSDHLTKHRKVHERRLLAASKAGKAIDGVLPHSVLTVRPGRKRKNQL